MDATSPPEPGSRRRKRVQTACERCRRQKLKCGAERPCPLCVHADAPCVPQKHSNVKRRRRQRRELSRERQLAVDYDSCPSTTARDDRHVVEPGQFRTPDHVSRHVESSPSVIHEGPRFSNRPPEDAAGAFRQRTSSFGIFREIIDQFSPNMVVNSSTSALPGGHQSPYESPMSIPQSSGLAEMLGMELPQKAHMDFLLESYLTSVHWFMMVFHEPSFRALYEKLLASRHLDRSERPSAIFLLLVLGMGARYADPDEARRRCPSLSLKEFQEKALRLVEGCLLELFDEVGLESVQICVLLGSFYLYNGRPNLGFVTLGCGIRCAQSMSLHRESATAAATVSREERRRVWWALYIFDRFASIVYGRPAGIKDGEFSVGVPENMDDTNTEHPAFHSDAETPNGILERVTLFSYIKFKIRLYTIASPIVGDIYFHRASSISTLRLKVQKIDNELSAWLQGLPPELRLDRLIDAASSPGWKSTADTFAMQAMALQVAYDNILILLHRPLLPHTLSSPTNGAVDAAPESTSQDRCWESAMRTSNLGKYQNYIELARQTHAAAFLGINLFTAGMVLSIVALSKPLSEQAQSAKHAIGRVLSLSRALQNRALLASQTSKVLIDLVRLILDKEMKAIMGQADRQAIGAVEGLTQNTVHPADRSNMVDAHLSWNGASMAGPTDDERVNSGHGLEPAEPILADTMQQEDPQQSSILSTFDLQHGLQSLQQAIYPSSEPLPGSNTDGNYAQMQPSDNDGGLAPPDIVRLATSINNLDTFGQSWLWEPDQWQDFGEQ